MATERQKAANARNAQLSTGPRTPEGRARSGQNRRPHGFCSEEALLTTPEDRAAWDEMYSRYAADYDTGAAECHDQIVHLVNAEFQRRMIARSEKGHFEESFLRAIDQLWGSQRWPDESSVTRSLVTRLIGITVMRDLRQDETFLKMSRYESEKLRNYNRALQHLKRNLRAQGTVRSAVLSPTTHAHADHASATPENNEIPPRCARSVSEGMAESNQLPTGLSAKSGNPSPSDTEPAADIPTVAQPASQQPITVTSDHAADILLTQITTENPISDISQPIQPDTLCKTEPEMAPARSAATRTANNSAISSAALTTSTELHPNGTSRYSIYGAAASTTSKIPPIFTTRWVPSYENPASSMPPTSSPPST
jgi:hypothetical protein